jgi:hypothetical protein
VPPALVPKVGCPKPPPELVPPRLPELDMLAKPADIGLE